MPVAVVAAGITVLLAAHDVAADDGLSTGVGLTCVPGSCDAEAKSVTRSPGKAGKSRPVPPGGPVRPSGGGGGEGPKGPPTISSSGWEFDLGGGLGILPRFDGKAAKKPESGGGRRVPVEVVVQRAVERLELPSPVIRTSPDEDLAQVVHVPTWMWVERDSWGPMSVSAAVEAVEVTATARPREVVWSMGEGGEVVCGGPGTPYSDAYTPKASSPDCGYTYRRASLSVPGGAYTVAVRVIWDVEWHGAGQSGVVPGLTMTAERRLVVDEVQAVVTH
ncbi:hypothetical protein [Streptomyces sp. 35G-GA-8]|uniref:hypothetical protein n=1 Tax=Streptomyces sp. 35G-GA-8 TaxID=2939434 RepID=UPI0027E3F58D|nr:hypothetical protein [Streptomyces sp. 35G-GA-8]